MKHLGRLTETTDLVIQSELDGHVDDTLDAHLGTAIQFSPVGSISAINVQAAIAELDSEKAAVASAVMDGDTAGGVLSGTYPNPGFAADMATQAELDAHVNDTGDAHDASAISYAGGTGMSATDVEAALDELATEKANTADLGAIYQPLDADLTTLSTAFASASASGPANLALHEDTDNGTNKVTIIAPATVTSDKTATLQDVTGTIYVSGGTDIPVADGGTGASDAATALSNLGGQPLDTDLTTIAGLTPTTNNFMVANSSAWASRTPAQAIAHLGLDADLATFALPASTTISTYGASLVDDADATTARATLGLTIGTHVAAYDETKSIWMSFPGIQTTGTGTLPVYFPYTVEILNFHLSGLTNTTVTLDVNRSGTTMFVTQGNRPALSASQTDATSVPDAATNNQLTTSQYLSVDIDVATGSPANFVLRCDYKRI